MEVMLRRKCGVTYSIALQIADTMRGRESIACSCITSVENCTLKVKSSVSVWDCNGVAGFIWTMT
jgi:hypothetical protein